MAAAPLVEPHLGGTVFVGATQGHVAAMVWNPAAAALLRGTHFYVAGQLRLDAYGIDRSRVSSADGEPSGSGDLTFDPVDDVTRAVGGFTGFSSDFNGNERFTLGLGFYNAFTTRDPEGDAIAYHANGGSLDLPTIAVSASVRVTSTIYVGLTFHLGLPQIDLRFRRDAVLAGCAAPPCPVESAAGAQDLRFTDDSQAFTGAFTLGGLMRLSGWWIGAAFTSAPFRFGENSVPFETAVTLTQGSDVHRGRARVAVGFPYVFRLGARRALIDGLDLVIDGRLTMGASRTIDIQPVGAALDAAGLPEFFSRWRGARPSVAVSAGVEQTLDPERLLRLGARLEGETGAVATEDINASQIEGPQIGFSAGLELRPIAQLAIGLGYSLGWTIPQDVGDGAISPSAQIDCNASGFDLDTCEAVRDGRAIPSAAGSYRRLSHFLSATVSVDFW